MDTDIKGTEYTNKGWQTAPTNAKGLRELAERLQSQVDTNLSEVYAIIKKMDDETKHMRNLDIAVKGKLPTALHLLNDCIQ